MAVNVEHLVDAPADNSNPSISEFVESLESQATSMELSGCTKEAAGLREWAAELRAASVQSPLFTDR